MFVVFENEHGYDRAAEDQSCGDGPKQDGHFVVLFPQGMPPEKKFSQQTDGRKFRLDTINMTLNAQMSTTKSKYLRAGNSRGMHESRRCALRHKGRLT